MSKFRAYFLLPLLITLVLVAGCDQSIESVRGDESVSGTIVYRERSALPPDAVAQVFIQYLR